VLARSGERQEEAGLTDVLGKDWRLALSTPRGLLASGFQWLQVVPASGSSNGKRRRSESGGPGVLGTLGVCRDWGQQKPKTGAS